MEVKHIFHDIISFLERVCIHMFVILNMINKCFAILQTHELKLRLFHCYNPGCLHASIFDDLHGLCQVINIFFRTTCFLQRIQGWTANASLRVGAPRAHGAWLNTLIAAGSGVQTCFFVGSAETEQKQLPEAGKLHSHPAVTGKSLYGVNLNI